MLDGLIRALPIAVLVAILPGWFWAKLLVASTEVYERVAYSVALSLALIPAVVLIPTRLLGMGVTLPVAIASPLIVFSGGLWAYLRFGPTKRADEPLAPPPSPLGVLPLMLFSAALALGVVAGVVPRGRIDPPVIFEYVPHLWVLPRSRCS